MGVTHGEFPEGSWNKFLNGKNDFNFAAFYLTDSCPDTAGEVKGQEPFVVCSIEEDVREVISVVE